MHEVGVEGGAGMCVSRRSSRTSGYYVAVYVMACPSAVSAPCASSPCCMWAESLGSVALTNPAPALMENPEAYPARVLRGPSQPEGFSSRLVHEAKMMIFLQLGTGWLSSKNKLTALSSGHGTCICLLQAVSLPASGDRVGPTRPVGVVVHAALSPDGKAVLALTDIGAVLCYLVPYCLRSSRLIFVPGAASQR
jgi:hypothetical protein